MEKGGVRIDKEEGDDDDKEEKEEMYRKTNDLVL